MVLAQGVGPLRRMIVRYVTRNILNHTRAITVRDQASAALLETLGVTMPPIEVTADPSFLLEPDPSEQLENWWASHIPEGRPVIGVALRHWTSKNAAECYHAISDALAEFAQHTGALLLFIPMQAEQDRDVAEQMAGWTPAESRVLNLSLTPREMLALVGRCDFILAMRLHTLIFAVQRATPAFGLSYDPKVLDFSLAADLPTPMPWGEIATATLTEQLHQQWDTRTDQRERLVASGARLAEKARQNIVRVKEVLEQR
jgi:polysaccharide pyruvyl transferase CsaB